MSYNSCMFILYAIPIGIVAGLLLGGRLAAVGEIRFRWAWLAVAGLAVQVVLFSGPVSERIGDAGPPIYVASTAAVLVAVFRNLAIPGIPLVVLGAASNLAAIAANGGYMPTSPEAIAVLGRDPLDGYSNSTILEAPALWPLTDILAMPGWMPFANVFSVGDILIALGVAVVIVRAMRADRAGPSPVTTPGPSGSG
jgi:hypothetical protein